jgi:hypothetical protein
MGKIDEANAITEQNFIEIAHDDDYIINWTLGVSEVKQLFYIFE